MNLTYFALMSITAMMASCAASKIPKERQVTIQTKANFKQWSVGSVDAYHTLEIESDGDERSVHWPADAPKPRSLNKNRTYTVDLLEEEFWMVVGGEGTSFWSPELFRLIDGDRILYDASVCHVHGAKMERLVVPISYGYPLIDPNYSRAEKSDFPNTGVVLGGCCINKDRLSTHAWVCPTCLTNKSRWEKQPGK